MAKSKTKTEKQQPEATEVTASNSRILFAIDERGRDRRVVGDLTNGLRGLSMLCPACGQDTVDLLIIGKHGQGHSGTACEYDCSSCGSRGMLHDS